jgi:hypothetical protein
VLVGLVVPRPVHFTEISSCIERLLPHVAPIASRHRFRMRVASTAAATTATAPWPRHDGTAGAVCGWGHSARPTESPPSPAPCGAGLECCAMGGAFVADSVCRAVPCGPPPP